jgi:hypothetical protein
VSDALRATHDALLASLARRQSTLHFAHGAVAIFVCFVAAGTAWRLSLEEVGWAAPLAVTALAVAGLALVYAVARLLVGRRRLGAEVQAFSELQRLRAQLGLDRAPTVERG